MLVVVIIVPGDAPPEPTRGERFTRAARVSCVSSGDPKPGGPQLSVLGELVIDLLPVPDADAGSEGTAPQYVARPGGKALDVAVAAGRLGAPVHLLARLGTGRLGADLRRHEEIAGVDVTGSVAAAEPVNRAVVGLTTLAALEALPDERLVGLVDDAARASR
jgi:fructokinase